VRTTARQIVFPARRAAELRQVEALPPALGEVAGTTVTSVLSAGTEIGMQFDAPDGFPHEPGYGAVFQVDAAGEAVAGIEPGDLAFCLGKHASRQRLPREEVVPLPEGLDPVVAVLTRMAVIGWTALSLAGFRPPARVMVTGLGAVGHFAARFAARHGYRVLAVDPKRERRELLRRFADVPLRDRVPSDDPEWHEQVHLCLECSGRENALRDACRTAIRGGEVVIVGVPWVEHPEVTARSILYTVFWRNLLLRSGYEWDLPWAPDSSVLRYPSPGVFRGVGYREHCAHIMALLAAGDLDVDGLYRTVSPEDCQSVYAEIAGGSTEPLCTVFDWRLAAAGP